MKHKAIIDGLPRQERPRERLKQFGPQALSAQELLALILSRGVQGASVANIAGQLLSRFGSLENISQASQADLQKIRGLGEAKAASLQACFELSQRLSAAVYDEPIVRTITNPRHLFRLVRGRIANYHKEHLLVLSFDTKNHFLGSDTVSVGILNANLVHPREVFDAAIRRHAAHIILTHNHPSSDLEPSQNDLDITTRLVSCGNIMGIKVIDHLVVSKKNYFSFKEHSLI